MAWNNNSSNNGLSAIPSNGGTGFLSWTSNKSFSNNAGYFLGDSTAGAGNVNVGGNSFAMYGHTSTITNAYRPFVDPLATVGDFFTCKFTLNFRNGFKGVGLTDDGVNDVFLFQAASDKYETAANGSYLNTGWSYSSNGIYTLTYTVSSGNNKVFTVSRNDGSTVTRTINSSTLSVSAVHFYVGFTTNGGINQDNLYFNSLSTYNPYR